MPAVDRTFETFYVSQCLAAPDQLDDLVAASLRSNLDRGITGMLVFTGGHFAQVIEGERGAVLQTMIAIEADVRHSGVTRLFEGFTAGRSFGQSTMAWLEAPGADEVLAPLIGRGGVPAARAARLRTLLFSDRAPAAATATGQPGPLTS